MCFGFISLNNKNHIPRYLLGLEDGGSTGNRGIFLLFSWNMNFCMISVFHFMAALLEQLNGINLKFDVAILGSCFFYLAIIFTLEVFMARLSSFSLVVEKYSSIRSNLCT